MTSEEIEHLAEWLRYYGVPGVLRLELIGGRRKV